MVQYWRLLTQNLIATRSFSIMIHGLSAPRKCRVDSSFELTLDLTEASNQFPGYNRIGNWRWLRFPQGMFTKKFVSDKAAGR